MAIWIPKSCYPDRFLVPRYVDTSQYRNCAVVTCKMLNRLHFLGSKCISQTELSSK